MATITTRAGKGSPLTNTEVDDNFSNLNSAKYESGSSPLFVNQLYVQPSDSNGTNTTHIAIGHNRTGNGYAHLDFVGDATWSDYGFRIIRNNNGPNASTSFNHNGTGDVRWTMMGGSNAFVINDGSHDSDFRVESNDNTHMLFVDASTNRVQFGSAANIENNRVQVTAPKTLVAGIPQHSLGVNDATAMAEGVGGSIDFAGQYLSDGTYTSFASVEAYKTNATSGNYDGTLVLKARKHGGDQVDKLRLNDSEAIFNEDGLDTDFRVESADSTHMLFVDAFNNHVGVDWATPGVPLDVNGVISSRPHGGSAAYSHGLLEISSGATNPQVKITTNILWAGGTTHAHTVKISGFRYGSAQTCELVICWHRYNDSFYSRTASSSGGFAPTITLAVENNKVVIHLGTVGYWPKLYVESMYNAYGGTSQAKGWSWSDAAISSDADTPTETVSYKTDLGGDNVIGTAGVVFNDGSVDADFRVESNDSTHMLFVDASANKVGVGTNGPGADFHVYKAGANANGVAQIYQNAATNYPTLYVKQRGEGGNSNDRQGLMIDVAGQNGGAGKMIATLTTNSNINSGVAFEPFTLWNGGTFQFRLGGTINENGQNSDFRVESESNTHTLFVDASAGHVNIGTADDYGGTLNVNTSLYIAETDTPRIRLRNIGNSDTELGVNGLSAGLDTFYIAQYAGIAANEWDFRLTGASREFAFIRGGVVNEGAGDSDFRVESAGNDSMLFVDAGNNRVNIGSSVNIGGVFNVAGTMKMMNTSNKVTSAMRPSGWGYSQGAYGVTIIGGDNDTGGTVSIGFDPSVNASGAFSGYGQEMIFNKDISFYQSNDANDAWVRQIRMENQTGVIFNENSLSDIDFRVESNTKNEMLYVDAGNDIVNINSTQTTHQMGGGYRADGLLRDFKRDEAVATFNDSALSSTVARTRRLVIPLYNYGPVEITIINGGHKYNNGGHFGTRVTKFYAAIEGTALRINTRRDIMQQGVNDWGVPVLTAHANATLRIDWTVAAQVTCSTHVRVVGYGANGITSCTTI